MGHSDGPTTYEPYDHYEGYDPHAYGKAIEEEKEAFILGLNNF